MPLFGARQDQKDRPTEALGPGTRPLPVLRVDKIVLAWLQVVYPLVAQAGRVEGLNGLEVVAVAEGDKGAAAKAHNLNDKQGNHD